MNVNIDFLKEELVGTTVPKPQSGTLSGHAAGEPFDKHVFGILKEHYPKTAYRQCDYLNQLYKANNLATTIVERYALIKSAPLRFLLNRGKEATATWSENNIFVEKQNDTADILVVQDSFFNIFDVKTANSALKGQPPNIISAYKVAQMCASMLSTGDFSSHDITYIGIDWKLEGEDLVCTEVHIKELFKTNPQRLYINWAAAMQIQFYVKDLNQDYKGTVEEWCREFLETFTMQAEARADTMLKKFVLPFRNILE